ncbi:MAG TPA: glycosyltransferase family 4 protein [Longimicrobium sp.]|jgi:glycosyltransferase involved in cell wall biosynthesis|nr:glycosyltransferase family 4 protein [Longimicrobium sp.]
MSEAGNEMTAPPEPAAAPLRVLAWPGFKNRVEQPYNWLLYTHLRELGVEVEEFTPARGVRRRASILHLHWAPTSHPRDRRLSSAVTRSAALLALLDWVRLRGTRVVWTSHDLEAHDRAPHPAVEAWFWKALARRLDGVLSMSKSGVEAVHARYPALRAVPSFVIPHGHYRTVYPRTVERAQGRARLGIGPDARVAAFVGQIRPYKNVPALLEAFRGIRDPSAVLLVGGMMKMPDGGEAIRRAALADPRVRLLEGFVPDDRLQLYMAAADLVVLPYRAVLNSGSAVLALSLDRPQLVPAIGSLVDLAEEVGPEWMRTYAGELGTEELSAALEWAVSTPRPASAPIDHLDWRRVARLTLDAYRAVLAAGR